MIRKTAVSTAVILAMFVVQAAHGQLTFFTSRPTFDAACPGLPVEDFEDARVDPGFVGSVSGDLDKNTTGGGFLPGDILDGIRLHTTSRIDLAVLGDTSYGVSTKTVFVNSTTAPLDLIFYNGGATCVGFDESVLFDPASVATEFFDTTGAFLGSYAHNVAVAGHTFLGVTSTLPIGRISLTGPNGVYKGVDNVAFGNASTAVPEPGALSLILAAAIPLALRRPRS